MPILTNNEDREVLAALLHELDDGPECDKYAPTPGGHNLYQRHADVILAAGFRRLPVSGDNAELIAKADDLRGMADGAISALVGDLRVALIAALSASKPREAAPSDTDRVLSDEELDAAYYGGIKVCTETTDDDGSGWDIAGLRAVEVAVLSRTSHPVQVEVSDEMVERAARNLNLNGWTCDGGSDEPGRYDECEDCQRVCRGLARAALSAALGGGDHAE